MLFMNEYDVEDATARLSPSEVPNLARAARALANLVEWTNDNSDGWPYWSKPAAAARKLMTALQSADRFDPQDITPAELAAALRPVRSFLTRQGATPSEVLGR